MCVLLCLTISKMRNSKTSRVDETHLLVNIKIARVGAILFKLMQCILVFAYPPSGLLKTCFLCKKRHSLVSIEQPPPPPVCVLYNIGKPRSPLSHHSLAATCVHGWLTHPQSVARSHLTKFSKLFYLKICKWWHEAYPRFFTVHWTWKKTPLAVSVLHNTGERRSPLYTKTHHSLAVFYRTGQLLIFSPQLVTPPILSKSQSINIREREREREIHLSHLVESSFSMSL